MICTVLYIVPRTSAIGAILLTGYLGGAVASNVRAGMPLFNVVFPMMLAVWRGADSGFAIFAYEIYVTDDSSARVALIVPTHYCPGKNRQLGLIS